MCQLGWTTGCPAISSNILDVSVRMFLNEINIWISRLSKADCQPQYGWFSSNQLKERIKQRLTILWVEWNSSCLTALSWDMGLFIFSCLWTHPDASALESWVDGFQIETYTTGSSESPGANCRPWCFSAFIITRTNSYMYLYVS